MGETSDTHPANLAPPHGRHRPATGRAGRAQPVQRAAPYPELEVTGAGVSDFVPARRRPAPSVGSGGSFVCLHRHDTTEPSQCSCTASASSPPCRPCRRRPRRRRPRHDHRPPRPTTSGRGHRRDRAATPATSGEPGRRWRWSHGRPSPPRPRRHRRWHRRPGHRRRRPAQVTVAVATDEQPGTEVPDPGAQHGQRAGGHHGASGTAGGSSTTAISAGGRSTPAGGSATEVTWRLRLPAHSTTTLGTALAATAPGRAADRAGLRVHQ